MAEKFNLKWNDFQSNVSKAFGLLRNETYLHDVTIVSDDFKHVSAHKLVLSACSDFFKKLFQETKKSQPVICLDGVKSTDLINVLDYVYEGEVKILQEDLDHFLSVAQKLKLEGLMGNESEEGNTPDEYSQSETDHDQEKENESFKFEQNQMERQIKLKGGAYEGAMMMTIALNGVHISPEEHRARLERKYYHEP